MLFSVITVSHNRTEETLRLMDSIRPGRYDYELVVVDMGNAVVFDPKQFDDKIKVLSIKVPDEHKAHPINLAYAKNVGAKVASGDWLVFIDCDLIPCNNTMFSLLKSIPTFDKDVFYGGVCHIKSSQGDVISIIPPHRTGSDADVFGFCQIIHKDAFKKLHGYDQSLFGRVGEDGDLRVRANRLGMTTESFHKALFYHPHHPERNFGKFEAQRNLVGGYQIVQTTKMIEDQEKYLVKVRDLTDKNAKLQTRIAELEQTENDAGVSTRRREEFERQIELQGTTIDELNIAKDAAEHRVESLSSVVRERDKLVQILQRQHNRLIHAPPQDQISDVTSSRKAFKGLGFWKRVWSLAQHAIPYRR